MRVGSRCCWLPVAAALLGLVGQAGARAVEPYTDAKSVGEPTADDERSLLYQSGQLDEALQKAGVVIDDPALTAYLQDIVDRLFPEFRGVMKVRLLRDGTANAFAMGNGSIYVHLGLLTRLKTEAQLATILGHEGAHFVRRHPLRGYRNVKSTIVVSQVLSIGTLGIAGGLPSLLLQAGALSSISGYSRDMEREADTDGFARLLDAGYAVAEAQVPFEILDRETVYMQYKMPLFFASHPAMQERVENFRELQAAAGAAVGETAAERYRARIDPLLEGYYASEVERGNYRILLFLLENERAIDRLPARFRHYLGEAYRLRNEGTDLATAEKFYREALAAEPNFAPAHGALGRVLYRTGRGADARVHFERYLQLAPTATDRDYVTSYLEELSKG